MFENKKWLTLAALMFGALLGYTATSGTFGPKRAVWAGRADSAEAKQPAEPAAPEDAGKEIRAADREAVQKATQSLIAALEKGDAEAVATHWTAEGEYISADGTEIKGRKALAKAYADYFAKKPKMKVEIEPGALRFPSRDTAIGEGYFKSHREKEETTRSHYDVLFVREGGQWLMAMLRESVADAVSLRDLDWLIGTWETKRDGVEVRTTYEWWETRKFIRANFTIKDKDQTITGFQMIGQDPGTGQIRSWTFEAEGGFGEAVWSRDGKKWVMDAAGTQADGSTLSATNILTQLDGDNFTWQSVERTEDGESLPDVRAIKVTRVKAKR